MFVCYLTVWSAWIKYLLVNSYFFQKLAAVDIPGEVRVRVRGPLAGQHPGVVALVRELYLDPPSPLPYNLSSDQTQYNDKGSVRFIHDHLEKLFRHQRGGFFVEAGALDGESTSNTLFLELSQGWTGLLVEPEPYSYVELLSKHRKVWTSNTCLSPEYFPKELVFVSLHRRKFSEISNYRTKLWHIHKSASHLFGVELDSHIFDDVFLWSDESYSVAQCFPLASYLLALNVSTIDLLSLDIQGVEKSVLQHLPWDKLTVRVLVVEIVHHEVFDKQFVHWMKGNGYILLAYEFIDYIFVREDDPTLMNPGVNPIADFT